MFRKIIFWSHLVSGVLAGLVVLTMSFTGVLLTYERQILAWAESRDYVPEEEQGQRLSLEQLSFIASTEHPDLEASSAVIQNNPGAPVSFSAGRSGSVSLNPYNGREMEVGSPGMESFFSNITGFHRWFNMTGESRNTARAITGASNLIFLFLVLSGIYLWLPKIWRWAAFRGRLLFSSSYQTSKARDFNWHHVMGIWSALPLAVVVATASVFYYGWANDLVYRAFGEEPPAGRGRGGPAQTEEALALGSAVNFDEVEFLSLDQLYGSAVDYIGDWEEISISLPREDALQVEFSIDQGNGGQPQYRNTMSLDRRTGEVVSHEPFSSQSPGRQARSIIRFLHTGEVLGIWGQTIAGLVSLTSLFMVWTGLALAYRRLIVPVLVKRRRT